MNKPEEVQKPDGELTPDELERIAGGVPNAGTTNSVIIQTGSAAISNDPRAIAATSS